MACTKGAKKTGGRKKGTPNKENKDLRCMILGALENLGNEEWLVEKANEHPTAFLTLLGKVLPAQVTGADGGPIEYKWIVQVVKDANNTDTGKA